MPDERYDDDEQEHESSVIKDLRKKAKRADDLDAEVKALRQESAILKAGITDLTPADTGSGRAPKWQMQEAIRQELGLPALPEPPDVADALAIALCHCYLSRQASVFSSGS